MGQQSYIIIQIMLSVSLSLSLSVASAADEAWYWPKPEVYVHVCSSNLLVWSTCTSGPAHATTSMYMYI